MSDDWPVVDNREYRPIPESWIEHGSDQGRGSPRVYAVSVARSVRDMISIRYATRDGQVYRVTTSGDENPTGGGIVPASLAKDHDWPRSLVPRQYVDSVDVLRSVEAVHMPELWSDRLQERDDADRDQRAATDGGTVEGSTERPPFVDPTAEIAECYFCGQTWEPTVVDGFNLSAEDEYYPKMVPVCPEHAGGCR